MKQLFRYLGIAVVSMVVFVGWGCAREEEPNEEVRSDDGRIVLCDSVFFREQRIYAPGDYGSRNYRIPALVALEDGTLVMANDKRKYNEGDLPEDIDIVVRRSCDQGKTWSDPVTIAKGTGRKHGYGDPALVECENGDLLCMFVGGNGLWASTEADPIRSYVCRSKDGGVSWSNPEEITEVLWGSRSENEVTRNYKASFFGSGNGLCLKRGAHKGRVMVVAAMCRKGENVLDNFVVYSDDNGESWKVSDMAYRGGDEAKVIELVDGRVLMSVRQSGARGKNVSADGGETWGSQSRWSELSTNACNGDLLRVSATDCGGECNILMHSLPNSMERENVSVWVSYDEGESWQFGRRLVEGPSVYSSLTMQRNGTIGAYVEKSGSGACELWYQNFSLPWVLTENDR